MDHHLRGTSVVETQLGRGRMPLGFWHGGYRSLGDGFYTFHLHEESYQKHA